MYVKMQLNIASLLKELMRAKGYQALGRNGKLRLAYTLRCSKAGF